MATTDRTDLYERMVILGRYGSLPQLLVTDRYKDLHNIGLGIKYRPHPLGMAMARVQLRRLPELNEKRRAWFARLDAALGELPGIAPQQVYPQAQRGGLLLYAGKIRPTSWGCPWRLPRRPWRGGGADDAGDHALRLRQDAHRAGVHRLPVRGLGGPWGSPGATPPRPQPRGSLPVTEALAERSLLADHAGRSRPGVGGADRRRLPQGGGSRAPSGGTRAGAGARIVSSVMSKRRNRWDQPAHPDPSRRGGPPGRRRGGPGRLRAGRERGRVHLPPADGTPQEVLWSNYAPPSDPRGAGRAVRAVMSS